MGSKMYRLCQAQAFPIRVIGMVLIGLNKVNQPMQKAARLISGVMRCKKGDTMETKEAMEKIQQEFGSRFGFLGHQLIMLSMTGQPCDVTFFERSPAVDVKIDQKVNIALMYGAGAIKLKEILENIKLSNGESASINDIWTVNPMPQNGFTQKELDSVDMAESEEKVGPNGETLRKMIGDTYHCNSQEQEDYYLRRFIAS